MKVLLVNPPIYDFAAYDLWMKPVGLLKIGAILKENDIEAQLFDFTDRFNPLYKKYNGKTKQFNTGKFYYEIVEKPNVLKDVPRRYKRYGLPQSLFIKKIQRFKPDVVLVTSVMTYWYKGVEEVVQTVRRFSNAKILIGGIYATLLPNHCEEVIKPDYISLGNDTQFFKKFFSLDIPLEKIMNTFPDYSFYDNVKSAVINTTYGCPYRCTYCASFLLQPQFVQVKQDWHTYFHDLSNRGVEDIAFMDDALLMDKEHFLKFANIASQFNFRFHIPNGVHVNRVDKDISEAFRNMNLKTVRLSVESIDPNEEERNSYKTTIDDFVNAVELLRKEKIEYIGAYLLAGLPNQRIEGIIKTIEFVSEIGVRSYISEYAPVPGTIEFNINDDMKQLDPLLHNNSVYSGLYTLGWEKLQYIKDYARHLNENIKMNI